MPKIKKERECILWFVYWHNGDRKCIVDADTEEEAKQKAIRFCGAHSTIYKVEKLDIGGSVK